MDPTQNTIYNQAQYPQANNNNADFYQGNNIYSQAGPQPEGNIYSQAYSGQENNPGLQPQMSGNIYMPPQDANIVIAPQYNTNENNYGYGPPIMNAEYPPQNNIPAYNAQINGELNSPYGLQAGANINVYTPPITTDVVAPTEVSPVTLNTESAGTSSAPLISPVAQITVGGICCREDTSMAELESRERSAIIILSVALIISSVINLIVSYTIKSDYHNLALGVDLGLIFYGFIAAVSVLRMRWIRYLGTFFCVLFLIGGIIGTAFEFFLFKENVNSSDKGKVDFICVLTIMRVIILLVIMNRIFYSYWGINCFKKSENSSGGTYYEDSTYYEGTTTYDSPSHIHISSPHHHSAPHHSAPHHSPHHSAPHHAPHHSAPHHAAHHSGGGHHGGGGRGHGRH